MKEAQPLQDLFENTFDEIEGGNDLLQSLRTNNHKYDITGLKHAFSVGNGMPGILAGIQEHGYLDVRPLDKTENGLTLESNHPKFHNNGWLDWGYGRISSGETVDIGDYDVSGITIKRGDEGSFVFYKGDPLAAVLHNQGRLMATDQGIMINPRTL